MTGIISPQEFHEADGVEDWQVRPSGASARFHTGSFAVGLELVDTIGALADAADHHPDVDLRYTDVTVRVVSHDVGGLTDRDVMLARQVSAAARAMGVEAEPPSSVDDGLDIRFQVVAFDAADLDAESTFWAGVLGGTVEAEDDWHMVMVDGEPRIGVQLAPDHVPPDWPDGQPPQQMHLDLWVPDIAAAHETVLGLGARLLQEDTGDTFRVYADPAGHPFCLCW
ncbi:VOC family protein [Cellulomonas bogoriensis]|uniref:VOC family protein n=1 Tax=Cellulomonas bogoriensis TaxID=301388 RepID=UPI0009FEB0A8